MDIVERLRMFKTGCDRPECERMIYTPLVCEEAADEIENLRKTRDELLRSLAERDYEIARLLSRIE
jgi:hypothetical protein